MTIGTNASLAEQIEYAPGEINFDLIVEANEELEEWRELGESAGEVKERINDLEDDINTKDKYIENLEAEVDELSGEIGYLKNKVEELECALEDEANEAMATRARIET